MTAILGISAFYHDSAAALVVDGTIVAAAQEERFTRVKHDARFPEHAVAWCLREAGLEPRDLDHVGFYDKPFLKFERLLETYLSYAPAGFRSFAKAMPIWFREKLHVPRAIERGLKSQYRRRVIFAEHHESHAASAFYPSPFDEAAILTFDGVGEWTTTSFGTGRGHRIRLLAEQRFPHSIGLLYSAFTSFAGFKVNSGEYKLMGLAPYGRPVYADRILDKLVDLKPDGSFRMAMEYFRYAQGLTMTSPAFERLFGGPPRDAGQPITQREMDLAASVQRVTEEIMLRTSRHVHAVTGMTNLCLAGGVALNGVGNGRIASEGPFERIWVQPAAGDAGGALGVATLIWHQLLGNARRAEPGDAQRASLLGPRFTTSEVRVVLDAEGARYRVHDEHELCDRVAALLAEGKVVAWFQGRMEFGPRALGARSILGDSRDARMQSAMNRKIKFRESFRPFAPAVLDEDAHEWFSMPSGADSPYMSLVMPVARSHRVDNAATADGFARLDVPRADIPAVTHVDGSARVQTVDAVRHPRFHRMLVRFRERTGCPIVVNTSFNVRGEPIVHAPGDAYRCFMATGIDALAIEDCLLVKDEQPAAAHLDPDVHLARFALDR